MSKVDLAGQKFHSLMAIRPTQDRTSYGVVWECICECGNSTTAVAYALKSGRRKSCGCKDKRTGQNHFAYSGYEGITGFAWNQIRNSAKHRHIQFCISIEDAWDVFVNQHGICALTGEPLHLATNTKELLQKKQTASLDRIDSSKGYEKGNIQWVRKEINQMKLDMSQEEFVTWCQVVDHYNPSFFTK